MADAVDTHMASIPTRMLLAKVQVPRQRRRRQAARRLGIVISIASLLLSTIVSLFTFKPVENVIHSYISLGVVEFVSDNNRSFKSEESGILRRELETRRAERSLAIDKKLNHITENSTDVCVPWSMNTDKWWGQNPEWDVYKTTAESICFFKEDTSKTRFFRELYELQNGDCSRVITTDIASNLWGSYIRRIAYGISYGLKQSAPVQIANTTKRWRYARPVRMGSDSACSTEDMFCYFLPLSRCSPGKIEPVPKLLSSVDKVKHQWIVEYVTRPRQWLRRRVYEYIQTHSTSKVTTPCAAIYIRGEDGSFALNDYISSLRRDVTEGRDNILVLEGSGEEVYKEASKEYPEYNWIFLRKAESKEWDPVAEVVSHLATFQLAKQCDVFVQKPGSSADLVYDITAATSKPTERVYVTKATVEETTHTAGTSEALSRPTMDRMCVPWEANMDTWWTHHPEWVLDTDTEETTCFRWEDSARTDFFRQIYENQFVTGRCTDVHTKHMWDSGFNADMHNVMDGLAYGLEQRRPFQIDFEPTHSTVWHYAALKDGSKPVCQTKDMFCFFLPLGQCEPGTIDKEAFRSETLDRNGLQRRRWLVDYVARPQQWLRRRVYEYLRDKAPSIGQSTVVMHVRRSDVVLHLDWSRKYYAIEDYLTRLREENIHAKSIFLLTDDANAIDEALEFHPEYNWLFLNRTRHRGAEGGWENQLPSKDPIQEMVTLLATFSLVKQCDTIVHGESGFADTLLFHMEATGKKITNLRVEENMDLDEVLSKNNTESVEALAQRLEERRKAKTEAKAAQ